MVNLCQGPSDASVKASLTKRNGIINTMKTGRLEIPDFTNLAGCRFRR